MKKTLEEQNLSNEKTIEMKNIDVRANGVPVQGDGVGLRCKHYDNVSSYCGVLRRNIKCNARYGSESCELGTFTNNSCSHKSAKYTTKSVFLPFGVILEFWCKSCKCGYSRKSYSFSIERR